MADQWWAIRDADVRELRAELEAVAAYSEEVRRALDVLEGGLQVPGKVLAEFQLREARQLLPDLLHPLRDVARLLARGEAQAVTLAALRVNEMLAVLERAAQLRKESED